MANRTCVTVLTWNRPAELKNTLRKFKNKNHKHKDILIWDNGSIDDTLEMLKRLDFDVMHSPKNLGVFTGTTRLWMEAFERGYEFILNLQDDFPCTRAVPFKLIEKFLDANKDVGFVRLNDKKEQGKNIATEQPIIRQDKIKLGEFKTPNGMKSWKVVKYNYHMCFNPYIFRASLVPLFIQTEKIRERGLMEQFEKSGLTGAKLYPSCFQTKPQRPRTKDWIR